MMITSSHLILTCLIRHLEAKGVLVEGEIADLLDLSAGRLPGDRPVAQEVKDFAAALRGPAPPHLTAIDGGKED